MNPKVIVVMPAYNAGRTLRMTYEKLPKESVHRVILVDDGSTDETLEVAFLLGARPGPLQSQPRDLRRPAVVPRSARADAGAWAPPS